MSISLPPPRRVILYPRLGINVSTTSLLFVRDLLSVVNSHNWKLETLTEYCILLKNRTCREAARCRLQIFYSFFQLLQKAAILEHPDAADIACFHWSLYRQYNQYNNFWHCIVRCIATGSEISRFSPQGPHVIGQLAELIVQCHTCLSVCEPRWLAQIITTGRRDL